MSKVFNPVEKTKLTKIMQEGISTLDEIKALTDGLNETIAAIAEEMEIKPASLKKAIKLAHKDNFGQWEEAFSEVENILGTTGKI